MFDGKYLSLIETFPGEMEYKPAYPAKCFTEQKILFQYQRIFKSNWLKKFLNHLFVIQTLETYSSHHVNSMVRLHPHTPKPFHLTLEVPTQKHRRLAGFSPAGLSKQKLPIPTHRTRGNTTVTMTVNPYFLEGSPLPAPNPYSSSGLTPVGQALHFHCSSSSPSQLLTHHHEPI